MVFEEGFMTLNILKLEFSIFIDFSMNLRAPIRIFVGKYQMIAILSHFKKE